MIKILKRILNDIKEGENIDLYLIVAISIPLVVMNLLGIALSAIEPVILSVLTLLAISSLVNRRKLEFVLEKINTSVDDVLLQEYPDSWIKDFETAKEICIIGINLSRTITTYYPLLQERIRAKVRVKVLIVNPDGQAHSVLVQRAVRSVKPSQHQALLASALFDLCKLKEIDPNQVEIRTIDFPPPFGCFAFNLNSPEGVIYLEQYPFKSKDDMPKMVFSPKEKVWYSFYDEQISKLWENSIEWQCSEN